LPFSVVPAPQLSASSFPLQAAAATPAKTKPQAPTTRNRMAE
jgi:hypothetical protein